jgi:hypothetical protein
MQRDWLYRENESVVGHSASIELSLGSMKSTAARPELLACSNTSEDKLVESKPASNCRKLLNRTARVQHPTVRVQIIIVVCRD